MGHTWRPHCHCPHNVSQDTGSACRTSLEAEADCKDATHQQVDAACDGQAGCPQDGGEQEASRYRQPGVGVEGSQRGQGRQRTVRWGPQLPHPRNRSDSIGSKDPERRGGLVLHNWTSNFTLSCSLPGLHLPKSWDRALGPQPPSLKEVSWQLQGHRAWRSLWKTHQGG